MAVSIEKGANILWVDFLANGQRLANQKERARLVKNAKKTGVTHLVIDAKIPYGHATYLSQFCPTCQQLVGRPFPGMGKCRFFKCDD